MRFILVTIGSEGDIRPYIALALELKSRNHEVTIAAWKNHKDTVGKFGIEYKKISDYSGPKPVPFETRFVSAIRTSFANCDGFLQELWEVCQGAEVLIYNPVTYPCFYVAEALGIPSFGAFIQPFHSTKDFPPPFCTLGKPLGGIFNRMAFQLFDFLHWQYIRKSINKWRTETLGLPALSFRDTLMKQLKQKNPFILYAFSPSFPPRPADWDQERTLITGYWYLNTVQDFDPPRDLTEFLDSGEPPVFISTMWNISRFTSERVREIGNLLGRRLIVQDLYGQMKGMASSPNIYYVKGSIPHEWLFKRISVAVHHGGEGISYACIKAGVPVVAIPAEGGNDHRFWAYLLAKAGIGIRIFNPDKGNRFAKKIASAVKKALATDEMRVNALEIGKRMTAENGLQNAIKIITNSLPVVNVPA